VFEQEADSLAGFRGGKGFAIGQPDEAVRLRREVQSPVAFPRIAQAGDLSGATSTSTPPGAWSTTITTAIGAQIIMRAILTLTKDI
jgi:hypothetical protein